MNKRLLLPLLAPALFLTSVSAEGQRTTRKNLHPAPSESAARAKSEAGSAQQALTPVVAPSQQLFAVKGYDKPLRSRRETFFATNNADGEATVKRIAFTITYYDSAKRMLHSRSESVGCDIPPSETRQISIPSWDKQQSFYYVRSTIPAKAEQATPYDITITVDTIFTAPERP